MALNEAVSNVVGPVTAAQRNATSVSPELRTQNAIRCDYHPCISTKFSFSPDLDSRVGGTIILPDESKDASADVVVFFFHQTTEPAGIGRAEAAGVNGDKELAYGVELAARGFPAVGLDHPGFGDYHPSTYSLGYRSVTAQMVWNHLVLLTLLPELGITGERSIVCIGHSLGGTNAMFFSQYCEAVRMLICSGSATTFSEFARTHEGSLSRWSRDDKYMPMIRSLYGDDPKQMPFDIPDLLTSFAPHPLFLSSTAEDEIFPASGAEQCADGARDAYERLDATGNFRFVMRQGPHQFDATARQQAYDFVDAMVTQGQLVA